MTLIEDLYSLLVDNLKTKLGNEVISDKEILKRRLERVKKHATGTFNGVDFNPSDYIVEDVDD